MLGRLGGGARLLEAFGQQGGEVTADLVLQLVGGLERKVRGGVVGPDPIDQVFEAILARGARLDVDELRHGPRGEVVLVLEARYLLVRRHPAVAVAVDPDEHIALCEIRPVERARRMRSRAELEHHGRELHPLDRGAHGASLVGELAEGRAHEHPEPLVGSADHDGCARS